MEEAWREKPNSVLTTEKVKDIRTLLEKGIRQSIIARKFRVSGSTISRIKNNKTWI